MVSLPILEIAVTAQQLCAFLSELVNKRSKEAITNGKSKFLIHRSPLSFF